MRRANIFMLLFCLLFSFTTLTTWAGPPAHSKGTPPTKTYWLDVFGEAGEFTFPLANCGAFDAVMTVQISGFWITHTGHPNRGTWEFFHSAVPTSIANSLYPEIYLDAVPGSSINRHWLEGPFQGNVTETGVKLMVTLPGYGVVIRDVGRIIYQWPNGPAEFLAGHWDTQDGDFLALCSALSG